MRAPAADAAGGESMVVAGWEGLLGDGIGVHAVDELEADVAGVEGEEEAVAVVGPLWEADGEDFLELPDMKVSDLQVVGGRLMYPKGLIEDLIKDFCVVLEG